MLSYQGFIGNLARERVCFGGADDGKVHFIAVIHVLNGYAGTDTDKVVAHLFFLDDLGLFDHILQLEDSFFQLCLFVLRRIILRVFGKVAVRDRFLELLGNFLSSDGYQFFMLRYNFIITLLGQQNFVCHLYSLHNFVIYTYTILTFLQFVRNTIVA